MATSKVHVVAIAPFFDISEHADRRPGDEFDVTEERMAAINSTRYGRLVNPCPDEPHSPSGRKAASSKRPGRPTKAQLLARAAELGVEVPEGATNPQIAALVAEAEG